MKVLFFETDRIRPLCRFPKIVCHSKKHPIEDRKQLEKVFFLLPPLTVAHYMKQPFHNM